jgi:hypothetical protein
VPDITSDGMTRVAWVPTIANVNAPTTTELNAGMLLQSTVTADGFSGFRPTTAAVPTSSLASTFETNTIGRTSYDNTMLRFKKQSGTDTVYDTLVRGTAGYIVVRRSLAEGTAWASAQKIEVYPAICGEVSKLDPEPNTLERYEVPMMISTEPKLRAAVA